MKPREFWIYTTRNGIVQRACSPRPDNPNMTYKGGPIVHVREVLPDTVTISKDQLWNALAKELFVVDDKASFEAVWEMLASHAGSSGMNQNLRIGAEIYRTKKRLEFDDAVIKAGNPPTLLPDDRRDLINKLDELYEEKRHLAIQANLQKEK